PKRGYQKRHYRQVAHCRCALRTMAKKNKNRWIDVSVPLYQGMVHWPGDPELKSELAKSLDRQDVCNLTALSTSVHIGTHMDAPRHFISGGPGIDQMPLDAVIGVCRV